MPVSTGEQYEDILCQFEEFDNNYLYEENSTNPSGGSGDKKKPSDADVSKETQLYEPNSMTAAMRYVNTKPSCVMTDVNFCTQSQTESSSSNADVVVTPKNELEFDFLPDDPIDVESYGGVEFGLFGGYSLVDDHVTSDQTNATQGSTAAIVADHAYHASKNQIKTAIQTSEGTFSVSDSDSFDSNCVGSGEARIPASMLSPPSSHSGDDNTVGDDDDMIDSLFPELAEVPVKEEPRPCSEKKDSQFALIKAVKSDMTAVPVKACVTSQSRYEPYPYAVSGSRSKNAVLARENRIKKKAYIEGLENKVASFEDEKATLTDKLRMSNATVRELREEITYLKSVIANQTTIGALLQNITTPSGGKLRARLDNTDTDSATTKITKKSQSSKENNSALEKGYKSKTVSNMQRPGVCLHVTDSVVSLEFCSKCNTQANESD